MSAAATRRVSSYIFVSISIRLLRPTFMHTQKLTHTLNHPHTPTYTPPHTHTRNMYVYKHSESRQQNERGYYIEYKRNEHSVRNEFREYGAGWLWPMVGREGVEHGTAGNVWEDELSVNARRPNSRNYYARARSHAIRWIYEYAYTIIHARCRVPVLELSLHSVLLTLPRHTCRRHYFMFYSRMSSDAWVLVVYKHYTLSMARLTRQTLFCQ